MDRTMTFDWTTNPGITWRAMAPDEADPHAVFTPDERRTIARFLSVTAEKVRGVEFMVMMKNPAPTAEREAFVAAALAYFERPQGAAGNRALADAARDALAALCGAETGADE